MRAVGGTPVVANYLAEGPLSATIVVRRGHRKGSCDNHGIAGKTVGFLVMLGNGLFIIARRYTYRFRAAETILRIRWTKA